MHNSGVDSSCINRHVHIHIHVRMHRVFSPDLATNKSKVRFVSAPVGLWVGAAFVGKACGFFGGVQLENHTGKSDSFLVVQWAPLCLPPLCGTALSCGCFGFTHMGLI